VSIKKYTKKITLCILLDSNGERNRIRVLIKAQQNDKHFRLFEGRDARRYALLNYARDYPAVSLW
jgi:hypothetical protein